MGQVGLGCSVQRNEVCSLVWVWPIGSLTGQAELCIF